MADSFAADVPRISSEAHRTMAADPGPGHGLDEERAISVLDDVIATEVVGWLRHTHDALAARGAGDVPAASLLTARADLGMRHAVAVAERIAALGGHPSFDPDTLSQRAHTDYSVPSGPALDTMLARSLQAERIVLASYREIAEWLGGRDPESRALLDGMAADTESTAHALASLLTARGGPTP